MARALLLIALLLPAGGCGVFPVISHEPVIRNPFPQLSRVAVVPFANLSDEKTVDTRQFALAYFNELQATPGFEVVPLNVVEAAMQQARIELNSPADARRLAQLLNVDAVVVGAVTEFSQYYPPRCGLQIQWYAANPCFHPIPPGYGLPWGTQEEEYIPEPLVYEAELALAREQLTTQTPAYEPGVPAPAPLAPAADPQLVAPPEGQPIAHQVPLPPDGANPEMLSPERMSPEMSTQSERGVFSAPSQANVSIATRGPQLPADWPDARGFTPPCPSPDRPTCLPTDKPVLSHTSIYSGSDSHFTEALANYEYHRDDGRFGGWQAYLQRSDDFIRFCCHMHIAEMLSARGGAGKTRVVWRWPRDR